MWDKFSAGWDKWDDVVLASIGDVGDAMIEALHIADDQKHLEVCAGTGEPGLTIAGLAPKGRVTLTDLSGEMLAVARRRAEAKALTNVDIRECSADDLPFDDASFDSAGCRFGFMFIPDVAQAVSELARVLKPGGRVCASVWVRPEANPWVTVPMSRRSRPRCRSRLPTLTDQGCSGGPSRARSARCSRRPGCATSPSGTSPRCCSPTRRGTGISPPSSPGRWWRCSAKSMTGPGADRATAIEAVKPYEADGKVKLPGMARCIVGTK